MKYRLSKHDSMPWVNEMTNNTLYFRDDAKNTEGSEKLLRKCQDLLRDIKTDMPITGEVSGIILRIFSILSALKAVMTGLMTMPAYGIGKLESGIIGSVKDTLKGKEGLRLAKNLKIETKTFMEEVNNIKPRNPKIIMLKGIANTAGLGLLAYATWCMSSILLK